MLQQILSDMYIDPELLEELPEEQKQFLFFKMREEQVRRWKVREGELQKQDQVDLKKHKNGKKTVEFLKGSNGEDWVWVMGEHENDKSIEQILEEEAEAKALEMAELEIQKEIALEKERQVKALEEKKLKEIEEERLAEKLKQEEQQKHTESDEGLPAKVENEEMETKYQSIVGEEEEKRNDVTEKGVIVNVETASEDTQAEKENLKQNNETEGEELRNTKTKSTDENVKADEVMLRRNEETKNDSSVEDNSFKENVPCNKGSEDETKPEMRSGVQLRRRSRGNSNDDEDRLRKLIMRRSREILFDFKSIRMRFEENAKKDGKEIKKHWRAQERKSKAVEEEIKQASLRVRQAHDKSIRSPVNALMAIQLLQATPSASPDEDTPPEPAPRKSKSRPLPTLPNDDDRPTVTSPKPPVPPRPRVTRRPASTQAAVNWFKRHQKPRSAVIDPENHCIAPWFQGLISRSTAEAILEECSPGTFLLRISERLFGYAISVRGEHRCKHFLVEAIPKGGYRLFGLGQHQIHKSLHCFINFHKNNPLSVFGHELLVEPICQAAIPSEDDDSKTCSTQTLFFPEMPTDNVVTSF